MNTTLNRMANAKNEFQTEAKRVLCVCSAGLLRSPTMANVLHASFGLNTRAAGIDEDFALIPVDDTLVYWADEIVCATQLLAYRLVKKFPKYAQDKRVVGLELPDMFSWNDPELRGAIRVQYAKATDIRATGEPA
jgi:predicted protein tyrosine phosphatase